MASASDSFPENGIATVLLVLPLYEPDTDMVGLIAFTLVVVLGTGDSVAITPPPCPLRPESGSCVGIVLDGAGAPNCAQPHTANTRIDAVTPIKRATETFKLNLFIFFTCAFRSRMICSCASLPGLVIILVEGTFMATGFPQSTTHDTSAQIRRAELF
jgi:hypothetical protein